jgi:hypothetical protein
MHLCSSYNTFFGSMIIKIAWCLYSCKQLTTILILNENSQTLQTHFVGLIHM